MIKIICLILLLYLLPVQGHAMEFTAPEPPESAQALIPVQTDNFAQDLWNLIRTALAALQPEVASAAGICLCLVAMTMLVSLLQKTSGGSRKAVELAGTVVTALLLLDRSGTMIRLGAETVQQISEYGKLLLPVLAAAMAAEGNTVSSATLYAGTAAFNALLGSLISGILVPMVYMYLAMAVAVGATGEAILGKIQNFIKWGITWTLKIILYIFTGYMGITGVVSGSADKTALKAAKITISGMVPVVGSILSDASEAVLVSAGLMKNAAGIYGLLSIAAIWISPFLKIGLQYLLLKSTAAVCAVFDVKPMAGLIKSFSAAMGLLLGMTGTVCVLQLISTFCYMKGFS